MWRIGNFAIGRITEVAHYETLLRQIEHRLEEMKTAHHTIVNGIFDSVRRDVNELKKVFEKERSVGQLLDSCKSLDLRIDDLKSQIAEDKAFRTAFEIKHESLRIRIRDVEVKLNLNTSEDR